MWPSGAQWRLFSSPSRWKYSKYSYSARVPIFLVLLLAALSLQITLTDGSFNIQLMKNISLFLIWNQRNQLRFRHIEYTERERGIITINFIVDAIILVGKFYFTKPPVEAVTVLCSQSLFEIEKKNKIYLTGWCRWILPTKQCRL